jgi:hypothetical protein
MNGTCLVRFKDEARRTGKIARHGGQACATKGKIVLNRKSLLLCFQRSSQPNGDFAGFICIE